MSQAPTSPPLLPFVRLGDPVLRTPTRPPSPDQPGVELESLVASMVATMHAAPGVGLAAPQIGSSLRIAVMEDRFEVPEEVASARAREPFDLVVLVDPRYTAVGKDTATHYEGCLSVPGLTAAVERPLLIDAEWSDLDGRRHGARLSGWRARIFQHETDHLDGVLYLDRALTRSLSSMEEYARRWAQPTAERAASELGF